MKHVLLLVALFFAAHSALGQTNTDPAAADTNTQQQVSINLFTSSRMTLLRFLRRLPHRRKQLIKSGQ